VIEYDGTDFFGWQVQKGRRTVQEELIKAIEKVTGERPTLIGASRTDAGVHAEGQVANFRTNSRIPAERLIHALNYYLPPDVKVQDARNVPVRFHSQFDARWKTYRYTVLNSGSPRPLLRKTALLVRGGLDLQAMRRAAKHFVGKKDFRAFGSEVGRKKTTVRTIYELAVRRSGDRVIFRISGDGFLYNMVRAIVGTLLRVGQGKLPPAEVRRIIEKGDRAAAGPVVGPEGLILTRVAFTPWKKKSRSSTSLHA
jgi:tRNA pseudouridine38-40 synthase